MSAAAQLRWLLLRRWFDPLAIAKTDPSAATRQVEHADELWQVAVNDYRQARAVAPVES